MSKEEVTRYKRDIYISRRRAPSSMFIILEITDTWICTALIGRGLSDIAFTDCNDDENKKDNLC